MIDFSNLSDRQLLDKLEKAVVADRLAESVEWAIVKEACDRVVEKSQEELNHTNVWNNPERVAELQILIKVLRNLLPNIVSALKSEGQLAFAMARERELEIDEP